MPRACRRALKARGLSLKRVLKAAVADLLPEEILQRGKRGFGVPLDRWFREDLRGYVETRSGRATRGCASTCPEALDRMLAEHDAGRAQPRARPLDAADPRGVPAPRGLVTVSPVARPSALSPSPSRARLEQPVESRLRGGARAARRQRLVEPVAGLDALVGTGLRAPAAQSGTQLVRVHGVRTGGMRGSNGARGPRGRSPRTPRTESSWRCSGGATALHLAPSIRAEMPRPWGVVR